MENKVMTIKKQRQRKMLLVLPILALPFITVFFWAMGGGKLSENEEKDIKQGFNLALPDAEIKEDKPMGKMDYYNQAQLDSAKFQELVKNDPNYLQNNPSMVGSGTAAFGNIYGSGLNTSVYDNNHVSGEIYHKLEELERLNKPITGGYGSAGYTENYHGRSDMSGDVQRLEQMMRAMSQPSGEDAEMKQINTMLENIMEIQNPGLAAEKMRQASEAKRGQVFTVNKAVKNEPIMILDINSVATESEGFFSINDRERNVAANAISAVIHENQTVVNGSTVKLRLTEAVYISGVEIPKDNFIFGEASLSGERLVITIKNIRYHNSIFPVELVVYDVDGIDGLYIPGAIGRDVAKQSADRSLQTIGIGGYDQGWGVQAANAGIETAKTLLSKKVKVIRVTVKAGYHVLLRDEKQKQDQQNSNH